MGKRRKATPPAHEGQVALDPALRELLDHVARDLAEEYLRLLRKDDATKPGRGSGRVGGKR